eukprot:NODE_24689_length_614_cov_5.018480.p3 GENE.NODE_24689_length_614_cov_5.018480~~NODE_24689_length_614_cov_5.018480.p3  ORF type:complete len:67 (-),score=34.43 NODE_24689_length_614_cov_5.018480:36-236(-)
MTAPPALFLPADGPRKLYHRCTGALCRNASGTGFNSKKKKKKKKKKKHCVETELLKKKKNTKKKKE